MIWIRTIYLINFISDFEESTVEVPKPEYLTSECFRSLYLTECFFLKVESEKLLCFRTEYLV